MTITEETMALRVITPVEPIAPEPQGNSGGNGGSYEPWPIPEEDPEGDEFVPARFPVTVSLVHPDRKLFAPAGVVRPAEESLGHITARRVESTFREAGWNLAVWYGEYTGQFWVWDIEGLHPFDSLTDLYKGMGWTAL